MFFRCFNDCGGTVWFIAVKTLEGACEFICLRFPHLHVHTAVYSCLSHLKNKILYPIMKSGDLRKENHYIPNGHATCKDVLIQWPQLPMIIILSITNRTIMDSEAGCEEDVTVVTIVRCGWCGLLLDGDNLVHFCSEEIEIIEHRIHISHFLGHITQNSARRLFCFWLIVILSLQSYHSDCEYKQRFKDYP